MGSKSLRELLDSPIEAIPYDWLKEVHDRELENDPQFALAIEWLVELWEADKRYYGK